jgi:hypothetical protein
MVVDHNLKVVNLDQDLKEGRLGPGHQDDGQDLEKEIELEKKRNRKGKRKSIPPVEIGILLRLKGNGVLEIMTNINLEITDQMIIKQEVMIKDQATIDQKIMEISDQKIMIINREIDILEGMTKYQLITGQEIMTEDLEIMNNEPKIRIINQGIRIINQGIKIINQGVRIIEKMKD